MSNDIADIDRALGGDLWVVQETEQLLEWLEVWLMIVKMYGLKVFRNLADPQPLIRGCRSARLRKKIKIG